MNSKKLSTKIKSKALKNIEYNPHSELKINVRKIPKELIEEHLRNHDPTMIEDQKGRYKLFYEFDQTKDLIVVIILAESLKVITSFYQAKKRRHKG